MKIFVSADYEGTLGGASWREEKTKRILEEVQLFIEALKEAGIWNQVETVTICDSHGRGENIDYTDFSKKLDEKVSLISGPIKRYFMMEGIDRGYDCVVFLGYHSRSGEIAGSMDHTYAGGSIYRVSLNGYPVGEMELNAYLAGYYGVPIALVSGDETLASQVRDFLGKRFPTVVVKRAVSRYCSEFFALAEVKKRYTKSIRQAFKTGKTWKIRKLKGEIELVIEFTTTSRCDLASIIPHIERINGYSVRYRDNDYDRVFRMLDTAMMVARTEYFIERK